MFYSASSTSRTRYGRFDRAIARTLVVALFTMTPLSATAGGEWTDPDHTTYDASVVTMDNSQAGQTTFGIESNRTTIAWQDLQQPNGNTTTFNFSGANGVVLNSIGAQYPSNLNGNILSNGTVAFANPFGIFIGNNAVVDVGSLVAIGASVSNEDFMAARSMLIPLSGSVENNGFIRADGNIALLGRDVVNNGAIQSDHGYVLALAGQDVHDVDWEALGSDFLSPKNFGGVLSGGRVTNNGSIDAPNAALFGGRVQNFGEIEIEDGTLLMVAADAVWVTEFDNPVLIRIPNAVWTSDSINADETDAAQYAIENHGHIDAGLGHVRLAASDPLGFAIRQGYGPGGAPASITAQRIDLEGGESGRVHLSGLVDASDTSPKGQGGEIDVTGSLIVLEDATLDASGRDAGGTIQIGGEQEGRGELQRARAVVVDADSQIRADAILKGDGGRVIVFAEDLTSVDGEISARGGRDAGDGGFVETSGLRNFRISRAPDVSAAGGKAGNWLIDPFNITISNTAPDCPAEGVSCLNKAVEAILSPKFDTAGFDGILRTVNPADNVPNANYVSADLIASALGIGTNITLSTQAFGLDPGTEDGDIDVNDMISINSANILEGTVARFTLLAARNINLNNNIEVIPSGGRSNLALTVELHANDISQTPSDQAFSNELLEGTVFLNADILTGGGDVNLSGASVLQQAGRTIDTDGGSVEIRTGTVNLLGVPITLVRHHSDPAVDPTTPAPTIQIAGTVDTSNGSDPGGDVVMVADSLNVSTKQNGDDPLDIVTGQLTIASTGQIQTGGGDITLSGGTPPNTAGSNFAGSVDIDGDLESGGGDVSIVSNHVDPDGDNGAFKVVFVNSSLGQGGVIDIDADITTDGGTLAIGNERTQSIGLDGVFDTTSLSGDTSENGRVRLLALDADGVDSAKSQYGFGEITIGDTSLTSISTSTLQIESRTITFSDAAGANPVGLTTSGSSTALLISATQQDVADDATPDPLSSGETRITGNRSLTFNANTQISADEIQIVVAPLPTQLNDPDQSGGSERPNSQTRLSFGGTNGAGQTAADGVRLNADRISIVVGDGATPSANLFAEDLGTSAAPTDFGLQRLTQATYDGLQLRDSSGAFRPEELLISQDANFTITNAAPTAAGQLDLGAAYDGVLIGMNGMQTTLESSDGVLTIEDAVALNSDTAVVMPGSDAGKSFVVLNGGLFLPVSPNDPVPTDDTVVFGDGTQTLGTAGTTAFSVESLRVSTSGDLTVSQQIVDSIGASNDLTFEAGRTTSNSAAAGRGTLTVNGGITVQADESLALLAGASGFGHLVFAGPGTTVSANEIELGAGGGVLSQNTASSTRSLITGTQANLTIRDASGATFGDAASSAASFSYRQDAAINAQTDLPTLDQFGLVPATGFRTAGDVEYSVRSDQSNIDLDDGTTGTNEGDRFRNAALSLVGVDSSSVPAIDVSSEFSFVGKHIELGGIGDFRFTQALATAFNRSGTDAEESLTLRAGLSGSGDLSFVRGSQPFVIAKAPRINLIAGNGVDFSETTVDESEINVTNARFDLAGPVGSTPTFLFQTRSFLETSDLPTQSQFLGGTAGLPDILALRTDLGILNLEDFDATTLPLDLVDDPGRLILESEAVTLSQTGGANLNLTSVANLDLRIRTNRLTLIAQDSNVNTADDAQVLIGARPTDTQPLSGVDSVFDGESLLIEAFDAEATIATVENLSSISADPNNPGEFDLSLGRGPRAILIRQDGAATPDTLFQRDSVSGRLTRTIDDDDDGNPIATRYTILSRLGIVKIAPENVNGSNLDVTGVADTANLDGVVFDFGTGPTPGVFTFESLAAATESSITIANGTQISATDSLSLAAGLLTLPADDPGLIFGMLRFSALPLGAVTTSLSANQVLLTAGPSFNLDRPDADNDGERDLIPNALLPQIDFTNLAEIILTGSLENSLVDIRQSADMDTVRGGHGDFLTPIEAGLLPGQWSGLTLQVVQGDLVLNDLAAMAIAFAGLNARTSNRDASMTLNVPNESVTSTPFEDFVDIVELQSNDITFQNSDPNTSINLATDKLILVSSNVIDFFTPEDELGRLRGDDVAPDRPIVRIHQATNFTRPNSELPRPTQYSSTDLFGGRVRRPDLSNLDIELKTLAVGSVETDLTFDDDLRARVTSSNLILNSSGNVDILLNGPTPGYEGLDYAALQLTSLEIETRNDGVGIPGTGTITIRPFDDGMGPAPLTVTTTGDQRLNGSLDLETTLQAEGRNITFTNDVTTSTPGAGLRVATSGKVIFWGDLGAPTLANRLDHLWVTFNTDPTTRTPNVEFGRRLDSDGDGIDESPIASDQAVWVAEDILFAAYDFSTGDKTAEIQAGLLTVASLSGLEGFLASVGLGRSHAAPFATIGKAQGDLSFDSSGGHFIMASGEKLSVGGTSAIEVDTTNGLVGLGDVSALDLAVTASAIGLVRRESGVNYTRSGATQHDAGASISANTIEFSQNTPNDLAPIAIGPGRNFRFGVPNPFDTANLPRFLDRVPVFELKASGNPFTTSDFRFDSTTSALATEIPSLRPLGASRSDLSGAFGPTIVAIPHQTLPDVMEVRDADRLLELSVEALDTPLSVLRARLEGASLIDDLNLPWSDETAAVTLARLDAVDAGAAIAIYEQLFGRHGERTDEVRGTLQSALDQYLANTRSRRVFGFEVRRFVKNRPSTLLAAFETLESLDTLFRYHRRLGLSPGEYRRIQKNWLRRIQPDGITLDELSEAIHPSRYVRGSDILDIFGQ